MSGTRTEVFGAFLRLGLTSFGGPVAHLGYMREEFVVRRAWIDEASFADLVAMTQMLPGPASSQLGIAIGTRRGGMIAGLLAWAGFTLPSAIGLTLVAMLATRGDLVLPGVVHGLGLAAVAVVAHAVLRMSQALTPDWPRRVLALLAAAIALAWATPVAQVAIILCGALIGRAILSIPRATTPGPEPSPIPRWVGSLSLIAFGVVLVGLAAGRAATDLHLVAFIESFYRAGALVFGGGHVVLPLLESTVVTPGWVLQDQFLTGYGLAQAVPGPLFAFAAYLGAVSLPEPNGPLGAAIALVAIYLPSFLLVYGAMTYWDQLRRSIGFRRALAGTNAVVVGILLAALYDPVSTSAIRGPVDVVVAGLATGALLSGRVSQVVVVGAATLIGVLGPPG